MLSPNGSLREFIQPVSSCTEAADLAMALKLLSQGVGDRLVLLDHTNHPTGLVSLQSLIPHLGLLGHSFQTPKVNSEITVPLLSELKPSVIQPLMLVSADLSLQEFLPSLQLSQSLDYALMDSEGILLGLLDHSRLLQFLASYLPQQTESTGDLRSPTLEISPNPQPLSFTHLTQQFLVQKTELEQQTRSQQNLLEQLRAAHGALQLPNFSVSTRAVNTHPGSEPGLLSAMGLDLHSPSLAPLLELLECLPIPLMLQTSSGHVVAQNSLWRGQAEKLLDPNWLRQAAASVLESPITAADQETNLFTEPYPSQEVPSSSYAASYSYLSHTTDSFQKPLESTQPETGMGYCQLGSKPDTCVCICPLKNGQEQVLQFIKIPIGVLSGQTQLDPNNILLTPKQPADQAPSLAAEKGVSQTFRLATLTAVAHESLQTTSATSDLSSVPAASPVDISVPSETSSETLWLVLTQDITEQQQLARELTAKNADLIQLNRLKDEFLACISHELRTPLTAVLGLSSLLKDQTLGELNQRQVHYAQLIYQSGRHLMAVVNDILDLTRMETGQLELVPEPVSILAVCTHSFEQARQLRLLSSSDNTTPETQLPNFSLEIEPGLEFLVADQTRLRQMLVHLLSNALKFTEVEQPIGLKVGLWGGWIAFTVWDTGIGIPADKQHLIFQKFQQLENPLTRRFEGTGLGLVLTQRLARLHGGDVTFLSKEGEGSQFTLLLPPSPPGKTQFASSEETSHGAFQYPGGRVPLHTSLDTQLASPNLRPEPEEFASIPNSAPATSRFKEASSSTGHQKSVETPAETLFRNRLVLIVEAVPHFIEALSDQLTGLGYRVVIARSGTEALEKARRLQPCTIFLNPVLPLLSGWDVLTLLKSSLETRQIPVLVTATKVDEERANRSHADGLLSLPIQTKALRQALRRLVTESKTTKLSGSTTEILTVLRLSPGIWADSQRPYPITDLDHLLHSYHYRILEADDLEQAELIARVWKPTVVLLDGVPADPSAYFQQFSQHTFLASLPLVTLDQETSQVANQVLGLLVFPCLAIPETKLSRDENIETSALLQVIQIAAGYAWKPSILAVDAAKLPISVEGVESAHSSDAALGELPQETEWLQALAQYLQTAGFNALTGHSWQEVLQQLHSQSVDLLVICWTDTELQASTEEMLQTLQTLPTKPPILVLDHRCHKEIAVNEQTCPGDLSGAESIAELPRSLQQLATRILPPSLSMGDLLQQIHQVMKG